MIMILLNWLKKDFQQIIILQCKKEIIYIKKKIHYKIWKMVIIKMIKTKNKSELILMKKLYVLYVMKS